MSEIIQHPDAEVTEEAGAKFLDAIAKGSLQTFSNGTTRTKRSDQETPTETEAIVAEMKGIGIGTSDLAIAFSRAGASTPTICNNITVEAPPDALGWTTTLDQHEVARQSAVDAIMRLTAETKALRCSFKAESPSIEQSLFVIRAGLIGADHPSITNLAAHAQAIGQGRTIFHRIDAELHNAEHRENGDSLLADLNTFRLTIAIFWMGFLFWQMSNESIARFMSGNRLLPAGVKGSPSAVSRACRELGLMKGPQRVVKSIGPNSGFIFRKGYPPPA